MGKAERKRAERVPTAEARRRIIDACNRLLRERRYRELTIEQVMHAAGLARTVFYRHFDSIADVVVGLSNDLLAGVIEIGEAPATYDAEVLRRQLELVVRTFREYGPLIVAGIDAAHDDEAAERADRGWFDGTVAVTAQLLAQGIARGHARPMATHEVSRALTAMNRAYLLDLFAHEPEFDVVAATEALWTVWSRTTLK